MREVFTTRFEERTRAEWTTVFENIDACVTPVLGLQETDAHPIDLLARGPEGDLQPRPAPRLSRSYHFEPVPRPTEGEHTRSVLAEVGGLSDEEIDGLISSGAAEDNAHRRQQS